MHRSLLLPTALLAALTALALIGTALSLHPPGLPAEADAAGEATNRRTVLAFYAAANAAIATGDLAPLEGIVAPELLADAAPVGEDPGRAGLGRRIRALHATDPVLRLTVADLAVDGDLVIAHLAIDEGPTGQAFLGLGLGERPAPWGPVDVLRVAAGRVVAHASPAADAGLLEPVLATPFDDSSAVPSDVRRNARVQRMTLAPGAAGVAGAVGGPRLLYVEAGTVAVEAITAAEFAALSTTLTAGEHLALRPGVNHELRNAGETPATVHDVSTTVAYYPVQQSASAASMPDEGTAARDLAGGLTIETPAGPVVLSVGRVALPPGARLAWAEAAGPVLLHVEAGTARLDPGGGVAWTQDGSSDRYVTLGDEPLRAGRGALIVAGNPAELRAEPGAPLTVTVVAWLPAN